jgi:(p)ppGpp synthase/HD superfamily hydrolase
MDKVFQAISFAAQRHHGQMRKDKLTPYVAHPFRVLFILRDLFDVRDPDTLAAGVLHDTIEDTTTDFDDIEANFGSIVAEYVRLLTKDKRQREGPREHAYFESLRTAPDPVKLCKVADTYDNVRDSKSLPAEKQEKARGKARRLLEIFGPGAAPQVRHALDVLKGLL